jgi:glutamine---fructose-6-phosphate transaminase (isomerizing)
MSSADLSWHREGYPELRDSPPWVMEEMIFAQSGLAAPIATAAGADAIAAAVTRAASSGEPIVVTGCGTSEHGALAVATLLDQALRSAGAQARPEARQALDAALDPRAGGVCIGISHDGTTRATMHALAAAREAGAATATIGVRGDSPIAVAADHVLVTPLRDGSWCHTVAYTSTILAGAAVARQIAGGGPERGSPIDETLALRPQLALLAARLQGAARILAVGL